MTLQHANMATWIAAGVAVLLGLAVQHQLGAPVSGLMVQAAGAGMGAVLFFLLGRVPPPRRKSVAAVGLAILLVVVALPLATGPELAGARRWVLLGSVSIQPSMVLLPVVIWLASVGRPDWSGSLLVLAVGCVLALQFDAAALTGLTLAWMALHARFGLRVGIHVWAVALGLILLTSWAWIRPDALPSVAWVEQVLPNAWSHGLGTGVMATVATGLVMAPLFLLARRGERVALSLAVFYLGLVGAALLGNYPLPVVGLGASLVAGWLIAIGLARASNPEPSAP
ncbi:FtsW/RodA/SpoVE family cell cycle protein [Brevundimonas sp.]|uniref:FtsW/RodA/SpoVE family cell cycle protein n=1 Tax=Brevundimonas sp. TaxID=1871086 RepID=UPI0025BA5070|nr:FtsW/RodA/SpoVE family cell cycle protein [Brevundimonas sp.]